MNHPITREQIAAVIKKHAIETLDGLTEEAIDSAQSLADVGASSLDLVEIVSASMRELKVKAPRSELMLIESVADLTDLLYQHANAQKPAPPTP
ncbi:MAG: phosphopantetheine-binding protein [Chthoniobacteraceae bacterium]